MLLEYQTGPIGVFIEQAKSLQLFKENNKNKFHQLTKREREILALIADGANNPEIALNLDISRSTVQNHRANIRGKLFIKSDIDYVKFALAFDMVQLP